MFLQNLPHNLDLTLVEQIAAYAVIAVVAPSGALESQMQLYGSHVIAIHSLLIQQAHHRRHARPIYLSARLAIAGEEEKGL